MDSGQSSWLLLLLALAVTILMALVAFGSLRHLRVSEGALLRFGGFAILLPVARVGLVFGTGLCAAAVLSLGAEGLPFPLGYGELQAPVLWLVACLASMVLAALPAWSRSGAVLCITGASYGLLATAVQCGWISAAGLRPGVVWDDVLVSIAAGVEAIVFGAACWLSLSIPADGRERPLEWRLGAGLLLAIGLAAGQEILITGAELQAQVGSVYARQLPGTLLCVVAGAAVPMVYAFVLLLRAVQQGTSRWSGRRETDSLGRLPEERDGRDGREGRKRRKGRKRHRVPML